MSDPERVPPPHPTGTSHTDPPESTPPEGTPPGSTTPGKPPSGTESPGPGGPATGHATGANASTPVETVPLIHQLQTRLALLILAVVAVLAGATAIQLTRAFEQARVGVVQLNQPAPGTEPGTAPETAGGTTTGTPTGSTATGTTSGAPAPQPFDPRAIVRSTLINLFAIFLFTLVGATLFSRRLLTEPIAELMRATRELAAGKRGVTLPVTSKSELGLLAEAFNNMSTELAEALDLLERRVSERTADLSALLELSNSTALTLELGPLLAQILERLEAAVGCTGATVYEPLPGGGVRRVAGRGAEPDADPALLLRALAARGPLEASAHGAPLLAVPLVVRDATVGVLLVTRAPASARAPSHTGDRTAANAGRDNSNDNRNDTGGDDTGGHDTGGDDAPDSTERRQLTVAFANQIGVALENAHLYQRVQERAALEERQHLARELHDSVSQALYAILLGAHTAQRKLDTSPDEARQALDYVENLAQAGIKEMRALIFVLRPESLENEGLTGVLRKQLDVLETRHGIDTTLDAPLEPSAPFATKQALYRIAQEALHNVVKHARASHVRVALTGGDGHVRLTVADDGVGFDPQASEPGAEPTRAEPTGADHLGLRSMRERARQILGTLSLTSHEGEGTTLTVDAPCDGPAGDTADATAGDTAGDTADATDPATASATGNATDDTTDDPTDDTTAGGAGHGTA